MITDDHENVDTDIELLLGVLGYLYAVYFTPNYSLVPTIKRARLVSNSI